MPRRRGTGFDHIIVETGKMDRQPCIRGLRFTVVHLYEQQCRQLGADRRTHMRMVMEAFLSAGSDGLD
ncbi:MAG: hypothetical protein M3O70_20065 [Actinomycetota bacterium]|nr:hypothetical protein [Actinomycetota bacterium]